MLFKKDHLLWQPTLGLGNTMWQKCQGQVKSYLTFCKMGGLNIPCDSFYDDLSNWNWIEKPKRTFLFIFEKTLF